MKNLKIYGCGIAGLLAANAFPTAQVFEAGPEGSTTHKALLRFRSSAVGDSVGIEFSKVRVHKGIYHEGKFVAPNIQLANLYSQKVIGRVADRSIWNLDPVDRFIAPENFIEQLVDRCRNRINYNSPLHHLPPDHLQEESISTIPMETMMCIIDKTYPNEMVDITNATWPKFKSAPIQVARYRVKGADVNQTVYFPDPELTAYRASITGDLLMVESITEGPGKEYWDLSEEAILKIFGLQKDSLEKIEVAKQHFGKIAPIDDKWRRKFIFELSHRFNIFSLGRYGCWRQILIDDCLKDINVIKKLINSSSYERKMAQ